MQPAGAGVLVIGGVVRPAKPGIADPRETASTAEPEALHGRHHYAVAWRVTAASWVACAFLQFALYLRPSPYGGPFLFHWMKFVIRPLLYELLAVWAFALPFLVLWLLLHDRPLRSPRWRLLHWALIVLMAVNLLFTAFDHELYRYLGIRAGPSFLTIYVQAERVEDPLFLNILAMDRGGAYVSPLLCFGVPALFLWWAVLLARRHARERPPVRLPLIGAIAILVLPLGTGFTAWELASAWFRLLRLEPAAFAMVRDYQQVYEDDHAPGDVAGFARDWQAEWLSGTTDRSWRFAGTQWPFLKAPLDPRVPAPQERWNVVIVQMESVRGVDTGYLNPDRHHPSATPWIDQLARSPDAAVYTHGLTFGPPSVNGRFATQCSIVPSSRRWITAHTQTSLYCLPDALRHQGYQAEMFSSGDIDMDNSTIWVMRMYDRLWRYSDKWQVDRDVFRRAAVRMKELGRRGPFIVTLLTATNHHPFRSLEPKLDVASNATVRDRILNTTRYTDDVLRELMVSLRSEPWFDHTLWIINSDHGYNLGEHTDMVGGFSLYRESVWTPYLIVGPHPRLPRGRHDEIVTLLDIAPTVADLIGLREANPWQGHSLLALAPGREIKFGFSQSLLAETGIWTVLQDPHDGLPRVYDSKNDWFQRNDLASQHPAMARKLLGEADRRRRFQDYLLRQARIWPGTPAAASREAN